MLEVTGNYFINPHLIKLGIFFGQKIQEKTAQKGRIIKRHVSNIPIEAANISNLAASPIRPSYKIGYTDDAWRKSLKHVNATCRRTKTTAYLNLE